MVYHFLWDRVYGLLPRQKQILEQLIKDKYETNGGEYLTNNNDPNPDAGFSLDESIAVAAACYKYGFTEPLGPLKIVTSQTWFRPYDVIPFLMFCKYKWTHYVWIPQLIAAFFLPWYLWIFCLPIQFWVSFSIFSSSLKEPGETSGKQLNFVQAEALAEEHWWADVTWELTKKFVNYTQAFSVYYPEEDHHINFMARQIWDWDPDEEA